MFKISEGTINSSYLLPISNDTNTLSISILDKYIDQIEKSLDDNTWTDLPFSLTDHIMIPHLVTLANKRKPGLNLTHLDSPCELPAHLMSISSNDYRSHKYIIRAGDDNLHTGVLDARYIEGKLSLILFEPTSLSFTAPAMLAFRIIASLERDLPDVKKPFVLQMDIQRSNYECIIFSLALAKKIHRSDDCILKLHHNITTLKIEKFILAESKYIADNSLPVIFYKHTQGLKRLSEYLETKPESIQYPINSKHEKIMDHIKSSYTTINGKLISKSIHLKRLTEYKTLREDLLNNYHDIIT